METFVPSDQNSSNPNQEVQSSAENNPVLKSNADIKKVTSQKCKNHPLKNAKFLHLKPNVQNPRICINCIQQYDISNKEYLQIKEVLQGSSNRDLFSFPVLKDPGLIQEMSPQFNELDTDKSRIDFFYAELEAKIKTRREKKQPQILQLGENYQNSTECWSKILDIDNLKAILYEENNEQKLISFINAHLANSESNTRTLRDLCDQFNAIQSQFSMEKPNQIKNLISSLIEQINFFEGNNPSPLQSVNSSDQFRSELQSKQDEVDQLQQQLLECRSQLQEQQLNNEELKVANQQQIIKISELQQQLNEEKENSRLKDELDNEKKEVLAFKSTDLLPTTNLVLGNYKDSKKLFVRKNDQKELDFFNSNNSEEWFYGRSYLDFILDPQVNYVVNVRLEQKRGQNKVFSFGLVSDQKKDDVSNLNNSEILRYNEQSGWGNINSQIKGQSIKTNDDSLEQRSFEMRISIQRKILKVGSLPNYDSVVQVDNTDWIEPSISYRLFLQGLNKQTKITITKLVTVSQFDNLM